MRAAEVVGNGDDGPNNLHSPGHPSVDRLPGPHRRFVSACRRARERKGLSQAQVAEVIKVAPDVIKRLESGKAEPSIVLIADLVRYLEIDIMNVIFGQRAAKLQDLSGGVEDR